MPWNRPQILCGTQQDVLYRLLTPPCHVQEATGKAHTAWAPPSVPSAVQELLHDPAAEVTRKSAAFWVLVAALKRFIVRPCIVLRCTTLAVIALHWAWHVSGKPWVARCPDNTNRSHLQLRHHMGCSDA